MALLFVFLIFTCKLTIIIYAEHSLGEVDIRNGIRKRRATNEASETAKRMADMPPNTLAVPVDSDYEVTKQLIQNEDVLELLMMSLDSYVNNDCLCIKSERFGVTTHGAKRSIDCYAYRKHIIVPHTIASLEGTDKLMKITRDVKITVRNTGDQTKVYLKPATRRDGSSPFDISLFGLVSEYNVLVAKKTCVTLTFASLVNETQECVIWGTRVDDKIEDNDCYNSSLSSCGVLSFALETRNTDPCHSYDEDDRRKTQKAQQEREIVI
ncbi:uncharacterized protein LOC142767657 isoform X3 [Rhipicephalus microplus]|uniref:uncharacterized protein LOC142767657 isoform X3 n=1 Tax=Rhipicephalus microplus TaxID=6941 RepID=UPI003F6C9322